MHKCQGQNSSISMSLKHFWISREERTCPITLSYMAFCFCSLTALGTGQLISLGFVHSRFIMAPVALWAFRKCLWCCSAWSCGELQCRLGSCTFLEEMEIVIPGARALPGVLVLALWVPSWTAVGPISELSAPQSRGVYERHWCGGGFQRLQWGANGHS